MRIGNMKKEYNDICHARYLFFRDEKVNINTQ